MKWLGLALRLGITAVAGLVLVGLSPLILDEWQGQEACPLLCALPAFYLVFLFYCAMV